MLGIVIREGFSPDMADMLLNDLRSVIAHFDAQPGHKAKKSRKTGKVHRHC